MNDQPEEGPDGHDWKGLKEVDRAIAENRFTEYRVKKAWADPWERKGLIAFGLIITGFVIFAVVYDLIL
jgi:hypothetical protein